MIEFNKIYNEDCLKGMKRIPDGSVDLVITDLPYGTTACTWDSVIPFKPLWEQYKRVCKSNAAVLLFGKQPFTSELIKSNIEWFKYELIWYKTRYANFLQLNRRPAAVHENIAVFYKEQPTYNEEKFQVDERYIDKRKHRNERTEKSEHFGTFNRVFKVDDGWRHPQDVLMFPSVFEIGMHPTQKPVDLLRYLIRTYSNSGDLVLDSCIGSGSTCVAAIQESRRFIGFETNKDYFDKAVKWVENEQKQLRLF